MLPQGFGICYGSGEDLVWELLVSYAFATGAQRWRAAAFADVWNSFVEFCDPCRELTYDAYAPVAGIRGIPKKLDLGDRLEIRRFPPGEYARLASLNPKIAGVDYYHRFTLWPTTCLVKRFTSPKRLIDGVRSPDVNFDLFSDQILAMLNEEVALLRALLTPSIAVPRYALIRDGYPRDPGGGRSSIELPWQLHSRTRIVPDELSRRNVSSYMRRRRRFLESSGLRGWEVLAA